MVILDPGFDGGGSGGGGYVPPPTAGQGWTIDLGTNVIRFFTAPADDVEIEVTEYTPGTNSGTTNFSIGSWCAEYGFPSEVEFFGDRLWFAGTPTDPQTVWSSQTGDYTNFGRSVPLEDTDAVSFTLNSRQVNKVTEFIPLSAFLILTTANENKLTEDTKGNVSPGVGAKPQGFCGSSGTPQSVVVGDTAIMVQLQGQKIFDIGYRFESDSFQPKEISIFADHLVEGYELLAMDWAPAPFKLVKFVRDDGTLLGCTYMPAMEVLGWHRHDTGATPAGDDLEPFIDIVCLPGTLETQVYFLVRRQLTGETKTYFEQLAPAIVRDIRDWHYVDSGLIYDGRALDAVTLTLSGGTTWGAAEALTLTASDAYFDEDYEEGNQYRLYLGSNSILATVTGYVSPTVVTVSVPSTVPVPLRNVALPEHDRLIDQITNAAHLDGRSVAVLADAVSVGPRDVVEGAFSIATPAAVVHFGLPYRAELQTLELNAAGGESLRDQVKLINELALLVRNTKGLQVGPDLDHLDPIPDSEFRKAGQANNTAVTGIMRQKISASWGENNGVVSIVSDEPYPAEILAIIPKFAASER